MYAARPLPSGLDPIRMDLGSLAMGGIIFGFYFTFLGLDNVIDRGFSNPMEKAVLLASGLFFLATRPMDTTRFLILLAFTAIPAISLLGTDFHHTSSDRVIRGYISYMVPWVLMTASPRESDAVMFMKALCWIPLFSTVMGYVLEMGGFTTLFYLGHDGANRLQGSTLPAFIASSGSLAVIACAMCARHVDQRYWLLALVNLFLIALSGGRMGIAISFIGAAAVVLTRYRITFGLIVSGVVGAASLVGLAFIATPDLILRIIEDSDSGREMLWASIVHVWDNHPYFGIGLGHQTMIVPENVIRYVITVAAHNEYIRIGVELGWVGLCLMSVLFVLMLLYNVLQTPKAGDVLILVLGMLFALFSYSDNALSLPTIFGLFVLGYYERFVGLGRPARIPLQLLRKKPPIGYGRLA